ncbi:MAG: hypothetical protein A2849_02755 [Candidatus Taylorbacteria bacterium RIFCSPHIGHO2_01_FULL_51_15]|uniref:DUF4430 domain-containing protein n=1 Tax=Candidatus Taylorbacteria bacterium RIFCSPHIGHO2_01_FULL_51_15 TaxID=1802304 RepID=A0A1G2MD52_9BACT|nr:MAG: hypothetical protein A2849_02755 [Candidatus Taylorbacteria bacterium RIFCSPHIGHO2_01_FULL_51_15]
MEKKGTHSRTYMLSRFHRKTLTVVVIGISLAVAIIPAARLFSEYSASIAYLKGKPLSPWSIMALSAVGESPSLDSLKHIEAKKAIDLEAPILALAAAGKDPRTFGNSDLISRLKGFYDGTQLGEASILNDDIFGLLALVSSGEKTDDATLIAVRDFVLEKQNPDGGFSFAVSGESDTNTTAAAIMALSATLIPKDSEATVRALAYLRSAQNDDGGFPYDPKSSWGTASDASSDAWVLMALQSVGSDGSNWSINGQSPAAHLEGLAQEGGYYLFQAGAGEDSFTPVTTSYALIALSGKTLPVRVLAPAAEEKISASVHIEGKRGPLCDADIEGSTALDALKAAAGACGISFHVQQSALGEYVDEISGEKASGSTGWLYSVNGRMPSVGAGAYALTEGDTVRWYFGNPDGTPVSETARTEVLLSATIPPGPLPSGGDTSGNQSGNEEGISLTVEVGEGGSERGVTLGFGEVRRGGVAEKTIKVKNGGAVAAVLSTSVSGDALFRRYVRLDGASWREYRATLAPAGASTTTLSLSVPADYEGSGIKNGALIFWATPVAK